MGSAVENEALVRRIMEDGFNNRNFGIMDELFTQDYTRSEAGGVRLNSLAEHIADLTARREEPAAAVVVVSDGRLDDPPEGSSKESLASLSERIGVPISTVAVTEKVHDDASIRRVSTSGAVLAHAAFPLHVEVGCSGDLSCDKIPVFVRELRDDGSAVVLAEGEAAIVDHFAAIDLNALGDSVKWEESRGGALFPHVYGRMPLDVVIAYSPLERGEDGTVKLPVAG